MKSGIQVETLQKQLNEALDRLPQVQGTQGEIHHSKELVRLLNVTDKLAQKRKDQYISSELFLLAAMEDNGTLGDILRKCGATKAALKKPLMKNAEDKKWKIPMQKNNAMH